MDPIKKNRSLLRPRAMKKRGNPIFVSSQTVPEREPSTVIVNEPEQSSSAKHRMNKRVTTPEGVYDSIEPDTSRPQLKRQRMNDEEDNKCDEYDEFFIVSLPLIAFEKRLDFISSRYDDNKCRPGTMAAIGKIYPKEILPSVTNPSSEGGNGQHSTFKAFDTAINNKWGLVDEFRESSPEVEDSPLAMRQGEDDKDPDGERLSEKQLRSESSDNTENGYDEKRAREKRACKSVFDLVRLMELRRVGLVKPPNNPAKHFQLIEEIRKCTVNLNKTFSINSIKAQTPPILETSLVVNQEVPIVEGFESIPVEDSNSTIEYNDEAFPADYSYIAESIDNNVANVTSPKRGDAEDDISYGQPVLRRRRKQHNCWQDIHERLSDSQEGMSFKDKLNPIAAAEYDKMDIVELDMYDELPNQFRSDVPKEFTRRWSTQDTEKFYRCIALLGLDFGRVATIMGRTQKQITNKYKTEQKNNDQRLQNALIRQGEFFEYRQKYRF